MSLLKPLHLCLTAAHFRFRVVASDAKTKVSRALSNAKSAKIRATHGPPSPEEKQINAAKRAAGQVRSRQRNSAIVQNGFDPNTEEGYNSLSDEQKAEFGLRRRSSKWVRYQAVAAQA